MSKIIAELDLQDVLHHALTKNERYFYTDMDSVPVGRLKQFAIHGCKCYFCGIEGDRVLITKDGGGGVHADVYSGNQMMNRDHIKPASKKGANEVWNMRPSCQSCNSYRGNDYTKKDKALYEFNHRWAMWHNRIWCRKINKYSYPVRRFLAVIHQILKPVPVITQYKISKAVAKVFK